MLRNLGNSVYVKKSNLTLRLLASSHHQTTSIWSLCHCKYYSKKNSTASVDYYKILGISPKATQKQIKQKFYELSKQLHPDRVQSIKADTDAFVKVKLAYEILSDVKARAKFDQYRLSPEKQSKSYDEWSQYATETARPYHNVRTSGVHGIEFEEKPKEQHTYSFVFKTLECIIVFTMFAVIFNIAKKNYDEAKLVNLSFHNLLKYWNMRPHTGLSIETNRLMNDLNRRDKKNCEETDKSTSEEVPKVNVKKYVKRHHWSHDNKMIRRELENKKGRAHKSTGNRKRGNKRNRQQEN